MLQVVPVKPSIDRYRQFVGDGLIDEIVDLGRRLRGRRVLHLNATAYGGGVAELLLSLVALELDAGLDVEWRTLDADEASFAVTKDLHNGLQGKRYTPKAAQWQLYLDRNADAARTIGDYDGVFLMPRLVRDELRLIEGLLSARRNGESSDNDEAQ